MFDLKIFKPKVPGSNLREARKVFKNPLEYFSLSQVCIHVLG